MLGKLKIAARNALPRRFQVPAKYWYGKLKGDLEPEMALLPAIVGNGVRVADIGGNRGIYAYELHKLGAKVEVFEPNPACAAILERWANRVSGVRVHAVALSSKPGSAVLHVPVDERGVEHDASASVEASAASRTHDVEVPLRPLDDFGFNDLEFIKIDVEGHEISVLAGAEKTIRVSHPALLIEIEQRHNGTRLISEIFDAIEKLGYEGYFLVSGRLIPIAKFNVSEHQSQEALATGSMPYFNNFLFLAEKGLQAGKYAQLEPWYRK